MDFEHQWQLILEDSMFAEDFTVSSDAFSFTAKGVFYSGTYEEAPQASYAITKYINKEFISLPLKALPSDIEPMEDLKLSIVESQGRGMYRVSDVSGGKSGTVTLSLQPLKRQGIR